MYQVAANDNGFLDIPLGSRLKICYRTKKSGDKKTAHITPGPKENHFYALFEEDDVDFTIRFENSNNEDRDVCFVLKIREERRGIVAGNKSKCSIETLTSNGRKFRFIRQSSLEGKTLVSTTAERHGLDRHAASAMLSEIGFNVRYSEPAEYPIYVKIKDSVKMKTARVYVNRLNSVLDLKKMMEKHMGVQCSDQIIAFKGKPISNDVSMEHLQITKLSVVELIGTVIPIEVTIMPNRSVWIEASCADDVEDLKMKIAEKVSIPVSQQRLYSKGDLLWHSGCDSNLKILKNTKIFLSMNESHDGINVHERSSAAFHINVKLPNGNIATVYACASETVQELIVQIYERSDGFADKIEHIKCLLRGKLLENELTLEAYDVTDACEVEVKLFTQRIFVKGLTGRIFSVPICDITTIEMIKLKILHDEGIPPKQQGLMYLGIQLQDGHSLRDYNIQDGAILTLFLRLSGGGCSADLFFGKTNANDNSTAKNVACFSERGAIAFGEKSTQQFSKCNFTADDAIKIEPFTIELRLSAVPLSL